MKLHNICRLLGDGGEVIDAIWIVIDVMVVFLFAMNRVRCDDLSENAIARIWALRAHVDLRVPCVGLQLVH